ncbi:MAG: GDYXXLXY domain-containing protein [Leptolyngbyaceae cyanobacterium bins.302]|nr:GDYXXLXY domain-containing protein [Leptolyngbyaceae cyanobacterium bins.302]
MSAQPDNKLPQEAIPGDRLAPELEPVIETAPRRLPGWRLWVPLLFQSMLIIAVPAQDAYTYATGKTVVLQTVPVDPYDLLRGYSQTLGYEISQFDTLTKLPGGDLLKSSYVGDVYVVLEAPAVSTARPPQAWKPVQVSRDRPTDLASNQIVLKGQSQGWRMVYGLETYYMPEDQREQINTAINQINQNQRQERRPFVVEVKVDGSGNSVPVSLWIRDRNYQF